MSDTADSLLQLLQDGKVSQFNSKRGRRARLEFFAADLSGLKLSGVDLSGAQLEKADLSDTDLSDAILVRANLSGADLSSTNLSGAELGQAKLRDCYIEDCDFSDANLMSADLSDSELYRCKFGGASLASARFKRSTLEGCGFDGVDAHEMKLSGAKVNDCSFRGSELKEVSMKGAEVSGGSFYGADLGKALLRETVLTKVNLDETILSGADLRNVKFVSCTLDATDMTRADLVDAEFEDCNIDEVVLLEAEVPPELIGRAMPQLPALGVPHLADASFATNGLNIAATWTEEDDNNQWVRVGVGHFGTQGFAAAPALPVPGELVLATALAATPDGYAVVVLVDRPGGVVTHLFPIDPHADNIVGASRRIELPYRPMVRPILRWESGALHIYGLASGNPAALTVMRVEDGPVLTTCHASAAGTARGFASDHAPVVLSKGGTLSVTTRTGPTGLASAPQDFPGKTCGVAVAADGTLALAWVPGSGKGFKVTEARPGKVEEPDLIDPKVPTGFLDAIHGGGKSWVGFLQPDMETGMGLVAQAITVPSLQRVNLHDDAGRGARVVRLASAAHMPENDCVVAIVVWDDGAASAWQLGAGADPCWTV